MASVWRVLPGGQRQYEDYTSAGTFVPVVEVTFEVIASGTVGTVKVPLRDYTEERVRALIDARAQAMAAVESLEG
jgi:hypothetical protein